MTTWLLPLLGGGAVVSILTAVLLHIRESPKSKAEAAKVKAEAAEVVANAALKIVTKLEDSVTILEGRLLLMDNREALYEDYARDLRKHIEDGFPPPPPAWPDDLRK